MQLLQTSNHTSHLHHLAPLSLHRQLLLRLGQRGHQLLLRRAAARLCVRQRCAQALQRGGGGVAQQAVEQGQPGTRFNFLSPTS